MKWQLWVTREVDLFERYLRVSGYSSMFGDSSKFGIKQLLAISNGGLTRQYVDKLDDEKITKIVLSEYRQGRISKLIPFWKQSLKSLKQSVQSLEKSPTQNNFLEFFRDYKYGRGVVLYTYLIWKSKEKSAIIKSLKEVGSWHEQAERETSFAWDKVKRILAKIAKKNKLQPEDLLYYNPDEFIRYLKNKKKISNSVIKERQRYFVLRLDKGKMKLYTGAKAKTVENRELPGEKSKRNVKLIKGKIANKGFVKGRVRIINTTAQMKKMKNKEILVSIMTTPRLVPAVKKAAAIITDEGGIVSHAAIISREFNIPCIVGTKYATKVFKDGDVVEVDANKGIVRKI
jgi:phosphohistidine swiveling domain-containing protein